MRKARIWKFGATVAAGIIASLFAGQASAAPTCTTTLTATNGGLIADSALGTGVCVQAADKLYGNFAFGNLPTGGDVLFSWTSPTGGIHTEEFVGQLTAGTSYTGIGFQIEVTSTGFDISSLDGDFDQTNPLAATSTLTKNGVSCTRDPTTCPLSIAEATTDLVITESLTLGAGADTAAIINLVTESPVPEPATLALLGSALIGVGLIRYRRR